MKEKVSTFYCPSHGISTYYLTFIQSPDLSAAHCPGLAMCHIPFPTPCKIHPKALSNCNLIMSLPNIRLIKGPAPIRIYRQTNW